MNLSAQSKSNEAENGLYSYQYEQTSNQSGAQSSEKQINEYKNVIGDINSIRKINQDKIINSNKKVEWNSQFTQQMRFETVEIGIQSLTVLAYLGNFKMKISTLMTCFDDQEAEERVFAEGAFGCVYKLMLRGKTYAAKGIKITMNVNHISLSKIYREYFMSFLASQLGVGPKIEPIMGFDIVTFKNKALFCMQMCAPLQNHQANQSQIFMQMTENLSVMHSMGFVHLDIKPENTAYSFNFEKYVYLDFGFSKIIKEPLGIKTLSSFAGTRSFCSEQMKKTYLLGKQCYVDLYYNDLISLKKTCKALFQKTEEARQLKYQECSDLQTSHNPVDYLSAAIIISNLKYLIELADGESIIEFVRANFYLSKNFYIILSDQNLKPELKSSSEICDLLSELKSNLRRKPYCSQIDLRISKVYSLKERPNLTPNFLTINHILKIEKREFQTLLYSTDFVYRLFLFFDPTSDFFFKDRQQKTLAQMNDLRKRIINKLSENLPNEKKQDIFYEKIRNVVIFFYNELRALKKKEVLISIRLMFLMMEDYSLLQELQREICSQTTNQKEKILRNIEFSLFWSQINHIQKAKYEKFQENLKEDRYGEISTQETKLLNFASIILSQQNYMEPSNQLTVITSKQLKNFKNDMPEYTEIMNNIEVLFCSLRKLKYQPNFSKTLLQCLYERQYQNTKEYEIVASFFKLSLRVPYSSEEKQLSIKIFKQEVQKLFQVLKKINKQKANFFSLTDNTFFYYDEQLAKAIIKIQSEHISSSNLSNNQQFYNSFQVVEWLLSICEGNNKMTKFWSTFHPRETEHMHIVIQAMFRQLKARSQRFNNQDWYIITTQVIESIFLLCKEEFASLQIKIAKLRSIIRLPYYNTSVLRMYLNLVYFTFQKKEQTNSLTPQTLVKLCEDIAIEVEKKYSDRSLFKIFDETALLEMLVKIYIKKGQWKKSFRLIKMVIIKMNQSDIRINLRDTFYILKASIQTFCVEAGFLVLNRLLKQMKETHIESLYPQDIYFEYSIFCWLLDHIGLVEESQIFDQSYYITLHSLRKQLIRISFSLSRQNYVFTDQVAPKIYKQHRLNLEFKSARKKLICLKREKQLKQLCLKFKSRVDKFPNNLKILADKKLNKLWENHNFIIPKKNIILEKVQK